MSTAPGAGFRSTAGPSAPDAPASSSSLLPRVFAGAAGVIAGLALGYAVSVARVQIQSRVFPKLWERAANTPVTAQVTHYAPGGTGAGTEARETQVAGTEAREAHSAGTREAQGASAAANNDTTGSAAGTGEPITVTVLGDSAASGVGANDPQAGYVGIVARKLAALSGRGVRVTNLSVPGASSWLLMENQLPQFRELPAADITLCIIGANDIADRHYTFEGFEWTAVRLYPQLPAGTVVSTIPSFGIPSFEAKERKANALIKRLARENDLELADLYAATARLWPFKYLLHQGGDFFHPNERGYEVWAQAVWPAVERAWRRTQ